MRIEVVLDTGGAAVAGVDQQALVDNIQAEVDRLTANGKVAAAKPTRKKPPAGAQGDWSSFHWVVDFVTDPVMAQAYAKALLLALNSLLQAAGPKEPDGGKAKKLNAKKSKEKKPKGSKTSRKKPLTETPEDKKPVRVTIEGKDFFLPVTSAAIRALLKHLGDQ